MSNINFPVKKYKFQKVIDSEFSLKVPTEIIYLFQFGKRIAIKVVPHFTTWQKEKFDKEEEIWKLSFVVVSSGFDYEIKKLEIQLSQVEREFMIEKGEIYELLDFINDYDERNVRTKEQFEADFNKILNEFKDEK